MDAYEYASRYLTDGLSWSTWQFERGTLLRLRDPFFCRSFLSLTISILVSQPLLLNYTHNTCSLDSAHSLNLACLLEVGQETQCRHRQGWQSKTYPGPRRLHGVGTFDQLWPRLGQCQFDCCKLMQCASSGNEYGLCWWPWNVGDGTKSTLE